MNDGGAFREDEIGAEEGQVLLQISKCLDHKRSAEKLLLGTLLYNVDIRLWTIAAEPDLGG